MFSRTSGTARGSGDRWYNSWNWKTYTLLGFSAVLVVVLSAFFFILSMIWDKPWSQGVVQTVYSSMPAENLPMLKNRTNVLVVGVDEREDDPGRSDTIFVVSIPSDDSPIVLLSIPRDTMVWLPEHGHYDKINHLYGYQGPEFTKSAVERLLDLPIKGYVVINLDGFVGLVNELGGVTVDIGPEPLYYYDPYQDLLIDLPAGVQRLNGKQAMGFVRYREYDDADIGRIRAQQTFIQAFVDEFMAKKYDLSKVPGLITQGLSMVRTDLGLLDIMALAGSGIKVADKPIEKAQLVGDGLYYHEIAYFMLRYEESLSVVAEYFFPEGERERYIQEHLFEPWVRDYEYVRQQSYNDMITAWERQTNGWSEEPEEATSIVEQMTLEGGVDFTLPPTAEDEVYSESGATSSMTGAHGIMDSEEDPEDGPEQDTSDEDELEKQEDDATQLPEELNRGEETSDDDEEIIEASEDVTNSTYSRAPRVP